MGSYCKKEIGIIFHQKGCDIMAKSYSRDFKKMTVELITLQDHSTSKTAEEFNIPLKTLENWITAYNKDNHCFDPDYVSPQETIARLEKENKKLKETNEILKKAVTFFAKEK